jgi:diguanylate cyclase (GGDEF)-like protein
VRPVDLPAGTFASPPPAALSAAEPVLTGPTAQVAPPAWLAGYGGQHVAWARLLVGDKSLGLLLLVRRAPAPFERADETELRAIAYRVAMAIENGLLHQRTCEQLEQLRRLHQLTTELAGSLELDAVARRIADMLVAEVPVRASTVTVQRDGASVRLSSAGTAAATDAAECFALEAAGRRVGTVLVHGPPPPDSVAQELLGHLLGLAALALDKALLHERIREQARRDSLTGLLGHRVFHEELEERLAETDPLSVVLIDIDDFKRINDVHGHQVGDVTLRRVADALRRALRAPDSVFRIGGEEFCVVLPGLRVEDAHGAAERLRVAVEGIASPEPVTVSLGVASRPPSGGSRDELLARADEALYASKRTGKNRTTVADEPPGARPGLPAAPVRG